MFSTPITLTPSIPGWGFLSYFSVATTCDNAHKATFSYVPKHKTLFNSIRAWISIASRKTKCEQRNSHRITFNSREKTRKGNEMSKAHHVVINGKRSTQAPQRLMKHQQARWILDCPADMDRSILNGHCPIIDQHVRQEQCVAEEEEPLEYWESKTNISVEIA